MVTRTLDTEESHSEPDGADSGETVPALVVVWSRDEPERVGEVLLAPPGDDGAWIVGRGDDPVEARLGERARFLRQRPGDNALAAPFASPKISRVQLRVQALDAQRIAVDNIGRRAMRVGGSETMHAVVQLGDVLELTRQLVLLCVPRPRRLPPLVHGAVDPSHAFGAPDRFGMVGESPAAWALRDALAFAGAHGGHALVRGGPGTGKELAARALHAMSARHASEVVVRNLATIPDDLVDAELFGHAAGFAGLGDEERAGLVGYADGATLVIDDRVAADPDMAARFTRLLDDGHYHRLGESTPRRSDLRVVVVSERDEGELAPTLLRRLRHRVVVPPWRDRREDVALVARHLLASGLADHPDLAARFLAPDGTPRVGPGLVTHLVRSPPDDGVRELEAVLWRHIAGARGDTVEALDRVRPPSRAPRGDGPSPPAPAELPDGVPDSVRLGLSELTPTELQVMRHLALNKTSRQIASALFVSIRTIQNHRAHICDKLGLRGSNRLLGVAIALGDYLGPPEP